MDLWLWELNVLSRVHGRDNGVYVVLFCKDADGQNVSVVIDDWRPWIRVLNTLNLAPARTMINPRASYLIDEIKDEEPIRKLYGWEPDENLESKKYPAAKLFFNNLFSAKKIEELLSPLTVCDVLQKPKTRFLNDVNLSPCSWFKIDDCIETSTPITRAKEYHVSFRQIRPFACETIPRLLIASFDCEMSSIDGQFPSPYRGDTIFCISTTFASYPESKMENISLFLGSASNAQCFDNFRDLAEAWSQLIRDRDPDIITGWNIDGFDLDFFANQYENLFKEPLLRCDEATFQKATDAPSLWELIKRLTPQERAVLPPKFRYEDVLIEIDEDDVPSLLSPKDFHDVRAQVYRLLNMNEPALVNPSPFLEPAMAPPKTAMFLSRFAHECCHLETKFMNTAAKGDNIMFKIAMAGRVVVDMMRVIKDDLKPPSNSLRYAAETWLKDSDKLDLSTDEMFRIFRDKDAQGANKVVEYCERDAEIPVRLLLKLQYLTSWIGLSKVTHLNPESIVNGGQQQRVFSLLSSRVLKTHAVNVEPSGWPQTPEYVGATVIEPDAGFFTTPISTLDFASLYPSIIGSNNLCFSTLVTDRSLLPRLVHNGRPLYQDFTIEHPMNGETITRQYAFVTHIQSVLADALISLLSERKAVKKEMEKTDDLFLKEILNKRQAALKVVCNSVYGFTGVDVNKGLLSCKPIAAVTTLIGRKLIGMSKAFVEKEFEGSRVVYGDTDSIMINWNVESLEEAFLLGEDASKKTTSYLRDFLIREQSSLGGRDVGAMVSIVKLEHEKEYWPYLLLKKKNYAGRKWTPKSLNPLVMKDEIDMKGIQAVRRDTVPFVADLSKAILDALLIERSEESALKLLRSTLKDVSLGKLPIEKYIISKSLSASYKGENIPHVLAWNKMKLRNEPDVPSIGGRMPFVYTDGKAALASRAEHPAFATKSQLKLDTPYYIQASKNSIMKLLQFSADETLDEIFRDALNLANSRNTISLIDFEETHVPTPPKNKKRPRVTKTQGLDEF
jgi:DNA polymerase elongation subunit (family B)